MKKIINIGSFVVIAVISTNIIAFAKKENIQRINNYTDNFFWTKNEYSKYQSNIDLQDKRDEVMYQIFPSAFADGNGDGKGDLIGVKNKIDYIKKLGIKSVWFNPIFDSPSNHRYDVRDDKKIDSDLGGDVAFENMMKEFKKNNIKVYLDFVPNHSSDQNKQFTQWIKDVKNGNIRKDQNDLFMPAAVDFPKDSNGKYKNKTSNTMWNHIEGTPYNTSKLKFGQKNAYFTAFQTGSMPDRNFASKATTNYLINVAKYWLDKGVDGFRIDAVPHLFDYRNINVAGSELMNEYWEYGVKSVGDAHYLGSSWFKYFANKLKEYKSDVYIFGETLRSAKEISNYSGSMAQFNDPLYNKFFKVNGAKRIPGGNKIAYFYNANEQLYRSVNKYHKSEISFISSHDKDRYSSLLKENEWWMKQGSESNILTKIYIGSFGVQLTMPDQPLIYYGDEVGLFGKRDSSDKDDIARRLPLPWFSGEVTKLGKEKTSQDVDLIYKNKYMLRTIQSKKLDEKMTSLENKSIFKNIVKLIKFRSDNKHIWALPFYNYDIGALSVNMPAYVYVNYAKQEKYVFITNIDRIKKLFDWSNHSEVKSIKYLDESTTIKASQRFNLKPGQTVMLTMKI